MPGRIERDSDIFLRLDVGQGRTGGNGPAHRAVQVADGDVQVQGRVLSAISRRPHRRGEFGFVLEVERRAGLAGRWPDLSPAVITALKANSTAAPSTLVAQSENILNCRRFAFLTSLTHQVSRFGCAHVWCATFPGAILTGVRMLNYSGWSSFDIVFQISAIFAILVSICVRSRG